MAKETKKLKKAQPQEETMGNTTRLWGTWKCLILLVVIYGSRAQTPSDALDELRKELPELPVESDSQTSFGWWKSEDSNLIYVSKDNTTIRLAELTTFLPFSETPAESTTAQVRSGIHDDAAVAMLAMKHFNDRNPAVVSTKQIDDCNVFLTMTLLDSAFSPIVATREFGQLLAVPHTVSDPLPAAVVGAYRSATTSPLAILSGVNDIPQIAYSSTSTDFDSKEQFPRFGRTIGSSRTEAQASIELYQSWNVTHVAVLFVTDSYGSALQKAFQDKATQAGISTESIAFSFSATTQEIRKAVSNLKDTQFRIFHIICFESHYANIMGAAYYEGLIGPGYTWIFVGLDIASLYPHIDATYPKDSPVALATDHVGLLQRAGGITPDPWLPNQDRHPALATEPKTGFQRFRTAWREALQDDEWLSYIRSKYPESLNDIPAWNVNDSFAVEPSEAAPYLYDAVFSLGLSMCQASRDSNDGFLTGSDIYSEFLQIDFDGATGRVVVDSATGTRLDHPFVLSYAVPYHDDNTADDGFARFAIYPSQMLEQGEWQAIRPYQFFDGSSTPPPPLPKLHHDYNYIGTVGRAVGYTLMGIVMVSCIASWIWLFWHRSERVVRSSQPIFLVMVSVGSFVMASSILPMGMEETVIDSTRGLDISCQTVPWLYVTGTVIAFSALLAKMRAVYLAYSNPELEFIVVTKHDILSTFAALFIINLIILIFWTVMAPLEWDRHIERATDLFGRPVESYGICANKDSFPYVVVLTVLNAGMLAIGNLWSYKSRNIETEYQESRYISVCMASVFQAWCMGVPILIMVWENPQAKFFVSVGIVFVTSMALIVLIFVPKVVAVFQDRQRVLAEEKRQAFRKFAQRKSVEAESWRTNSDQFKRNSASWVNAEGVVCTTGAPQTSHVDNGTSLPHGAAVEAEPGTTIRDIQPQSKLEPTVPNGDALQSVDEDASNASLSEEAESEGIKVLHNPRSLRNLELALGRELSRAQLANFQSSGGCLTLDSKTSGRRKSALPPSIDPISEKA